MKEELVKLDKEQFSPLFGAWWPYFEPLFDKTEVMDEIYAKLKTYKPQGKILCPQSTHVYRGLASVPPKNLKVMFVLLDPYPSVKNNIRVANGIAMDCSNTGILQPSLEKFYGGIEQSECPGEMCLDMLRPASLSYLIEQGVMFFNTALTVEKDKTGSHGELWEPFMKHFYQEVMSGWTGMIYVLCGKDSQRMKRWINPLGNYIFEIEHPSFAARQYRDWDYEDVFKKINFILKNNNGEDSQIFWHLTEAPF